MDTMKFYMKFKDYPIVGHTFTRMLVQKVYFVYEIATTFIEASEETIHVFSHSFPLHTEYLNYVLNEVKDNMDQAISYVA